MSDNWDNQDDSGDLLSGGGSAVSFNDIGDRASGIVVKVKKSIDVYEGVTSTWPNGDPKHVFIFTLDDNGEQLAVFCRGNMVKAVREAAAKAGVASLVGHKLTVEHHALGEPSKKGYKPAKLFRAKVEPAPATTATAADTTGDSW